MRGAVTIWTGSAFDCPASNNEIYVLPSRNRFLSIGVCSNGAIVANVISVEENIYTSQVNVTVTSEIVGKTIECYHYDGLLISILNNFSVIDTTGLLPCELS